MTSTRALVLIAFSATAAVAQRPDFTGEWVRDDPAGARAPTVAAAGDAAFRGGDMGTGLGSPLTIAQRTDSLILQYVFFVTYDMQPPVRLAFAMDGAESRNDVMIGHEQSKRRSKLSFQGNAMVITTTHPIPATVDPRGSVEVRQTFTLESATSLTITTSRAGVFGGPPSETKATYTKK